MSLLRRTMSKGSTRRKRQVSQKEFDKNWQLVFGKKKEGLTYEEGRWFLNIADVRLSLLDADYE